MAWEYVSYRVFNPFTGTAYKVFEEQLKKADGEAIGVNYKNGQQVYPDVRWVVLMRLEK